MGLQEELIKIREEIRQLEYKAENLPRAIYDKEIGAKINILKQKERELKGQMTQLELYGVEMSEQQRMIQSELEQKNKTKKTLLLAGSISGLLLLTLTAILIIKKRRNK